MKSSKIALVKGSRQLNLAGSWG